MARETQPRTYRVSDEVDTELRRRAAMAGGVDRALRELLFVPGYSQILPSVQRQQASHELTVELEGEG